MRGLIDDPTWYRDRGALVVGVRLALVVTIPLVALYAAGLEEVAFWAALGAVNIVMTGYGGTRRAIVGATSAITLAMAVFALLGPVLAQSVVVAVVATFVVALVAGALSALNDYWRVGQTLALMVFVVAVGTPGTIETGLDAALGVVVGGLVALAGLLLVPGARSSEVGDRIGATFREAARALRSLGAPGGAAARVHTAAAGARAARDQMAWAPSGYAPGGRLLVAILHDCERIASDVERLLARTDEAGWHAGSEARLVGALSASLDDLDAAVSDRRPPRPDVRSALASARAAPASAEGSHGLGMRLRWLARDVEDATANVAERERSRGSTRGVQISGPLLQRWFGPRDSLREQWHAFRRALAPDAAHAQQALRLAIALAAATALYRGLDATEEHGLWVPLTVLVVLQAAPATSMARTVERVVGTLVGIGLGLGLIAITGDSAVATFALLPVLLVGAVYVGRAGYAFAAMFISALVLMLFDLLSPDALATAGDRVLWTLAGAAIGLAAAFGLWPNSLERQTLAAGAAFMGAVGQALSRPGDAFAQERAMSASHRYATALREYVRQPGPGIDTGGLTALLVLPTRLLEIGDAFGRLSPDDRRLHEPGLVAVGARVRDDGTALQARAMPGAVDPMAPSSEDEASWGGALVVAAREEEALLRGALADLLEPTTLTGESGEGVDPRPAGGITAPGRRGDYDRAVDGDQKGAS